MTAVSNCEAHQNANAWKMINTEGGGEEGTVVFKPGECTMVCHDGHSCNVMQCAVSGTYAPIWRYDGNLYDGHGGKCAPEYAGTDCWYVATGAVHPGKNILSQRNDDNEEPLMFAVGGAEPINWIEFAAGGWPPHGSDSANFSCSVGRS